MNYVIYNGQLYHHGIKGMKWGRRRWQTKDGSLTPAGKKRYGYGARFVRGHAGPGIYAGSKKRQSDNAKKDLEILDKGGHLSVGLTKKRQEKLDARDRRILEKKVAKLEGKSKNEEQGERKGLSDKQKKALKIGAAVAGTALAVYGAKKFSDYAKDKAFKQAYERGSSATLKFMKKMDMEYSYSVFSGDKAQSFKIRERNDQMFDYLLKKDMDYAKRASKNTVSAVKTLLGKNYEIPVSEMMNSGIKVFVPDFFDPKKFS